ncbi:MAG TPA: hypothetical protein VLK65_18280 [Vicinamibacteria bacterium]|nr:hypothetical protein [Vicinamibacteria bacterium]
MIHQEFCNSFAGLTQFENGRGELAGEEEYRERAVKMRFLWKDITSTSATWEQAYLDERTGEWETNWIMTFTQLPLERRRA